MERNDMQHVFIIGAKSIGQYGGYETFVDRVIGEHEQEKSIKYHVACKANGDGSMDESKLADVKPLKRDKDGNVLEFEYKNAHVFKIPCPSIGPAVAVYYDRATLLYAIDYCKKYNTSQFFIVQNASLEAGLVTYLRKLNFDEDLLRDFRSRFFLCRNE